MFYHYPYIEKYFMIILAPKETKCRETIFNKNAEQTKIESWPFEFDI